MPPFPGVQVQPFNKLVDTIGGRNLVKYSEQGSIATACTPALEDKADVSTVLHNNALNQIVTDYSGIIIGNDKDFGLIKHQSY